MQASKQEREREREMESEKERDGEQGLTYPVMRVGEKLNRDTLQRSHACQVHMKLCSSFMVDQHYAVP